MIETKGYHIKLEGSNYEIGKQLAQISKRIPSLANMQRLDKRFISKADEIQMYKLFDEFCPGINEEIVGFTDVLNIPRAQVLYYMLTYLRPGCNVMAVLPSQTKDEHVLLARSYDFSEQCDDMTLCTTRVTGKYAHIGFAVTQFGRADGMNECGLAIGMSSAGMPVGEMEFARKPAITGLQFWAVVRTLLENCKNVDEAICLTKKMPIAYNINMIVADKNGSAALIESFDGEKAIKRIDANTEEQFICSTNHVHLSELKHYDPKSMKNSTIRYELINHSLNIKKDITKADLKMLLSRKYPEGLCCHFYDDFFGTLRGMVLDVNDGVAEVCFGSPALNNWHIFKIEDSVTQNVYAVRLKKENVQPGFYEMI